MRKFVLLAITAIAGLVASMLLATSARADGNTVVTAGPGQYTLGFTHPTGTLSIGGGTTSARCTAAAAKGNAFLGTPRCTTRKITCPFTAPSYCSVVVNMQDSALRGPVAFVGGASIGGGIIPGSFTTISPYNCPQANVCTWKFGFSIHKFGTVQLQILNITNDNYPIVFAQATSTAH